jgi:hypothetical protein
MKRRKSTEVPHGTEFNSYIQPSSVPGGQPAHVVQDGWIAYLPSVQHAKPSFSHEGRGFFKGHGLKSMFGK